MSVLLIVSCLQNCIYATFLKNVYGFLHCVTSAALQCNAGVCQRAKEVKGALKHLPFTRKGFMN